ncbi:thiazole synthase [Bacterioplanes sanyensis]|uniref:thiazole synthase n=1 Tax=Bacterioplanes sanyensis TaxID=1249553 RepID=UPI0016745711|nr:thiazole synthase [Bacterioplanes sanyensis]
MCWERLPVDNDSLNIAGTRLSSRLWLGSSLYPSPQIMADAIQAATPGMVTVSLRRQTAQQLADNDHWAFLQQHLTATGCQLLPNTAGCHSADEAVMLAHMARELFGTAWIKLEVIGDDYNLQPHPLQLLNAAERLVNDGFVVLPYSTDDLVLCRELHQLGCAAVMPWGAPIGTGRGLQNKQQLQQLRERLPEAVLVIDAGLGKPSQAMAAMEMGFDAVLLNTAVAKAQDPVAMAAAFAQAVNGGRQAWQAGLMVAQQQAAPSTATVGLPFWHQEHNA